MPKANDLVVDRDGHEVDLKANVEGQEVHAHFNLLDLVHTIGAIPQVHDFWHDHVANILKNSLVESVITGLLDNPPDEIDVPEPPVLTKPSELEHSVATTPNPAMTTTETPTVENEGITLGSAQAAAEADEKSTEATEESTERAEVNQEQSQPS